MYPSGHVLNAFVNNNKKRKNKREQIIKLTSFFSPPPGNDFPSRGDSRRFIANLILLYSCFMPYSNTASLAASKVSCPR